MKRLNVFATFLFMFLVLAAPGFSQGSSDRDYWGSGWGYGHMMFGGLPMIVFWGAVVLLVVLLARWFAQGNNTSVKHEPRQTPLEILQERFVRGEIDKSEYEERKKTLQQQTHYLQAANCTQANRQDWKAVTNKQVTAFEKGATIGYQRTCCEPFIRYPYPTCPFAGSAENTIGRLWTWCPCAEPE